MLSKADLWRKLLRVAAFQGGSVGAGRMHQHIGIELINTPNRQGSASGYLKGMVGYPDTENCTEKRLEEIDTAAWNCVLNFEEIRTVGKPAFALTNTYMGWRGELTEHLKQYPKSKVPETLIKWLTEFEELED
jgi:hypothetical protein